MTRTKLIGIRPAVRRAIVAHARRERPNECCGFIVGRDRDVLFVVPMENVAGSPVRYRIDDRAHIELRRILRRFTPPLSILGVYHSHPRGDAKPSPTDVESAFYPEWVYVIVGLGRKAAEVGAFSISAGRVRRVRIG